MNVTLKKKDQLSLGILIIIVTVFAMASADAIIKFVSADLPLWQIYVVRSALILPVMVLALWWKGESFWPKSPLWVITRAGLLVGMYLAIYVGMPMLDLSVIAAALYTAPLFITLFSALLVGEAVGKEKWFAVVVGFIGVLLIIRPGTAGFTPFALIPILAALLYALAAVITRAKCIDETPLVLGLALNVALLLTGLAATFTILRWQPTDAETSAYPFLLNYWQPMRSEEWILVVILACLMLLISIGLAKAYQSAPPAVIATFDYSYLIFAVLWGYVLFAELPDVWTVAGMILIAGAGLLSLPQTD